MLMNSCVMFCFFVFVFSGICASAPDCQDTDCCLYAGAREGFSSSGCYAAGAVWLREEGGVMYGYCMPECESLAPTCFRASCDRLFQGIALMPKQQEQLKTMMRGVLDAQLCSEIFASTPRNDIICAFADFLKQGVLRFHDGGRKGVLHPQLNSWSFFDHRCCECFEEDKVVCSDDLPMFGYSFGSVWTRVEASGIMVFYRPENAAQTFLCYGFAPLNDGRNWPKNWNSVLCAIIKFSCDMSEKTFDEYFLSNANFLALVVKAVLCGRGASLEESVWFAWRPVACNKEVAVAEGDKLLQGIEGEGVYALGSVWLRGEQGQRALFYRSHDDLLFRYFPAAKDKPSLCDKLLCTEADVDVSWKKVVYHFIMVD